ncbi:MAG: hypothetical protein RLY86_2200 [Pseudomonadota bacterium]|jgi:membrane protein DedA with SNARE-associated domain
MFDWILSVIQEAGYLGLLALMFLENLFPPIPSELIMPLAGFLAARGEMNPVLVVLVGTAGSVLGALPWYWVGRGIGRERVLWLIDRFGFWLTLSREEVERADDWFQRRGWTAVLLGRLVPAVRTLISVPAGLARMGMPLFLILTTLGSLVWSTALVAAGYLLESQYRVVESFINPVSKGIVILIVGIYVYRVARGLLARRQG